MPLAGAMVTLLTEVAVVAVGPGEKAAEASSVGVLVSFDSPGAVDDEAAAEDAAEAEAGAEDAADADVAEERDEGDADSVDAVGDWLAEQPATARTASTAQTGATLILIRRAMLPAGAHAHGFLAIPQ